MYITLDSLPLWTRFHEYVAFVRAVRARSDLIENWPKVHTYTYVPTCILGTRSSYIFVQETRTFCLENKTSGWGGGRNTFFSTARLLYAFPKKGGSLFCVPGLWPPRLSVEASVLTASVDRIKRRLRTYLLPSLI